MTDRIKHFLSGLWITITGLTLAQINAALGCLSLVIGISYQIWKWRLEAKRRDVSLD